MSDRGMFTDDDVRRATRFLNELRGRKMNPLDNEVLASEFAMAREEENRKAFEESAIGPFNIPAERAELPPGAFTLDDRPDPWAHRSAGMRCRTCMFFVEKNAGDRPHPPDWKPLGRCRRNAPTMSGFPAVFSDDWCGAHKLDETKL
jgi:hypothetical protein